MTTRERRIFVQIGTNDGNDLFNKVVKKENPDLVLLIEPVRELRPAIEENYKDFPTEKIQIISKAISYDDKGQTLYIPKKPYYNSKHLSLVPMNDWGEKEELLKYEADTIRFDTLCKQYNISSIEYLQIDTEGFDTEIIQMIDFSTIQIDVIRFEKWMFDTDCFTKHNVESANSLGKKGIEKAKEKLEKHGYSLYDVSDEDGNDILAVKKVRYTT